MANSNQTHSSIADQLKRVQDNGLYGQYGGGLGQAQHAMRSATAGTSNILLNSPVVQKKLDEIEGYLFGICSSVEEAGWSEFIEDNPKLKKWFRDFKEKEIERVRLEKEEFDKATQEALEYKKHLRHYVRYLLDENLDDEDRTFFERKLERRKNELGSLYYKFEGLEKVIDRISSSKDK